MKGGSYIRKKDGALERVGGTKPAPARDELVVTLAPTDKPLSPEGELAMSAPIDAAAAELRQPRGKRKGRTH